jgi:two-component system, LytTR family, response regulator
MIRVLIVDDEQPARERLRELLRAFQEVQVVGEADSGEQAIERINQLNPDLVLLDIQMPACNGIEVAASLVSPRPKIIFCTAFEQYAVDAFELSAADYLLKPVSRVRLAQALERIQKQNNLEADANVDQVMRRPRMTPGRFLGRRGSRFVVIPQRDVVYLGSEGGLTKLHTTNQHYVMEPSLNDFDCRLDPSVFCRVSRTAIVNLGYVTEVDTLAGGYGDVLLKNGVRLEVSRRRLRLLLAKLEGE